MPVRSVCRRRFLLRTAAGALTLGALPAVAWAALPDEPRAELARQLSAGDLTVYFRHGATTRGGVDRPEWPRERQRLLSEAGEAQARAVGEAFRRHGWPVGEVIASPMARCRDMAEIAFGRVHESSDLLGLLFEGGSRQRRIEQSLQLLRRSASGGNRILVGHSSNIQESTGVHLPEGGAVLVRAAADGSGFTVLGRLDPADWAALAEA